MFSKVRISILFVLLGLLALAPAAFAQDEASSSNIYRFADGSEVDDAWSTLRRYENGLAMSLHTSDLVPGDAYTVWWVIFNEPQNCSDSICNEDDLFVLDENGAIVMDEFNQRVMDPEALVAPQISIQYATGSLIDEDGSGDFAAAVGVGDVPGIVAGPGLVNPDTAEVHVVVRTHGPKVDALFTDQILTFGGGCEPADAPPCADIQFAVHQAS